MLLKILMPFTTIKAAPAGRWNLLHNVKSSKLLIGNLPGRFLFLTSFIKVRTIVNNVLASFEAVMFNILSKIFGLG